MDRIKIPYAKIFATIAILWSEVSALGQSLSPGDQTVNQGSYAYVYVTTNPKTISDPCCNGQSTYSYSYSTFAWSGAVTSGDQWSYTVSLDTSAPRGVLTAVRHVSVQITDHYICDSDSKQTKTINEGSASATVRVKLNLSDPPDGMTLLKTDEGECTVCNDGDPNGQNTDPNAPNYDSDWQAGTAWPGQTPIDASTTPYAVASKEDVAAGVQTGDWALMTNPATGQSVWGRVAEIGPSQPQGKVEISNAAARALGVSRGYNSASGNVRVQFYR